jgi:hypothetical protein
MKRAGTAALILAIAGFFPSPAGGGPDGAGPGALTASGSANDSEKLGRDAQRELARLGCFTGDANESWGREGRAAIKRFNQTSQVIWPDWPTAGLIDSLRTHEDGYCKKCRDGDACTAAPAAPENPPIVPPAAKQNEEIHREKPAAPVSAPVQAPPAAPPDAPKPAAAPGGQEQASPPIQPQAATAGPAAAPEANTGKPDSAIELPAAVKAPGQNEEKRPADVAGEDDDEPDSAAPPKRRQSPKPRATARREPAPAPQPAPAASSRRGVPGGGTWPGSGPNLDGR